MSELSSVALRRKLIGDLLRQPRELLVSDAVLRNMIILLEEEGDEYVALQLLHDNFEPGHSQETSAPSLESVVNYLRVCGISTIDKFLSTSPAYQTRPPSLGEFLSAAAHAREEDLDDIEFQSVVGQSLNVMSTLSWAFLWEDIVNGVSEKSKWLELKCRMGFNKGASVFFFYTSFCHIPLGHLKEVGSDAIILAMKQLLMTREEDEEVFFPPLFSFFCCCCCCWRERDDDRNHKGVLFAGLAVLVQVDFLQGLFYLIMNEVRAIPHAVILSRVCQQMCVDGDDVESWDYLSSCVELVFLLIYVGVGVHSETRFLFSSLFLSL